MVRLSVPCAVLCCMQAPSALQMLHQYRRGMEAQEGSTPPGLLSTHEHYGRIKRAKETQYSVEAGVGRPQTPKTQKASKSMLHVAKFEPLTLLRPDLMLSYMQHKL